MSVKIKKKLNRCYIESHELLSEKSKAIIYN